MTTSDGTPGFARDIRPLFRDIDIDHMSFFCDLSKYEDVRDNAQEILNRLSGVSGRRMPPGSPWSPEKIALFKKWMDDGLGA
jgi:hypothetical protein